MRPLSGTFDVQELAGKLAPPAKSIDFQRAAQQDEFSQAGLTFKELVNFRYLQVPNPPASHAHDVVMRLHVAVIARNIMQGCYLARLSHFAKLLQDPMDSRQ